MPTTISTTGDEPVTVDEAHLAARVDTDDLNLMIAGLITASRQQAEHITGRVYCQQVLRVELTDWPAVDEPIAVHAATACAVTYWDGSGWAMLSQAAYVYAPDGSGTVLAPVLGTSWPTLPERAAGPRVRIDLTAGPTDASEVSEQVKLYIKASVAAWINNPDAIGKPLAANPLFERLLDAERLY